MLANTTLALYFRGDGLYDIAAPETVAVAVDDMAETSTGNGSSSGSGADNATTSSAGSSGSSGGSTRAGERASRPSTSHSSRTWSSSEAKSELQLCPAGLRCYLGECDGASEICDVSLACQPWGPTEHTRPSVVVDSVMDSGLSSATAA